MGVEWGLQSDVTESAVFTARSFFPFRDETFPVQDFKQPPEVKAMKKSKKGKP
jgi:hypothetical protein